MKVKQIKCGHWKMMLCFVLMMVCCLVSWPSQALTLPGLSVPDLDADPGSSIAVPISLTSTGQIAGLQFMLNFDPDILTFDSVKKGVNTAGMIVSGNLVAGSDHQVIVIVMNLENDLIASGTGSVAVLNFKVKAGAVGSCGLNLSGVMLSNADGGAITPFDQINGTFTVKKAPVTEPFVVTRDAVEITATAAKIKGEITSDGGGIISAYGFQWRKGGETAWTPLTVGTDNDNAIFSAELTGLEAEETYSFQAFATNELETVWGDIKNFTTAAAVVPAVKPTVLTKDAANVTPAGGTLQGEITGNGGGTISAYGFLWSGDNKVSWTTETLGSSEPAGGFEKALGGLTAEKTYYYQAFATNEAGTTTGAVKEFTTEAVPVNPVLTAGNGSGLAGADVQIPVNLSSQGQIAGLQFTLSFDPAILTFTGVSKGTNTADMTVSGNLVAGSDHQAIVIVMNMENDLIAAGTGSVAVLNFKVKDGAAGSCGLNLGGVMLSDADGEAVVPFDQNNGLFTVEKVPAVKPTVLTKDAANVTPAGGTLQGEITGNGGGAISAYGFLWSGDNKVSWTTETLGSSEPAGGFEKALGGLTAEKTYYYQAFATNEAGTTTGAVKEFTTEAVPVNPVLTAGNGSGLAGADVQIPVNLSSQGQIAGLQFNLSFDPAILTFTGVSKGTNTADMTVSGNLVAGSDHQAIVIVMNMENDLIAAGTGSVAVLNFKVKDGAAGSCGLNLGGVMLSDADGEAVVPFDQNNGLFTVEKVPAVKPTVLTKDAANVTPAGGTLQGEITGNGGGAISAYGFLWSGDNKVSWTTETLGSSEPAGGFEKALSGLTAEKTYYYQAFATNEAGTTTGAVKEFTTEAVPVNPVLTAGNGSGLAGADVQIPVNLSSQGQIAGLQFNLSFDPAILTFTGVSKGTNTADMTVSGNLVAGSDHQAIVIVMNMENDLIAAGTGSVAVLNFKVKDGAAGSCGLNLGGVMLSDADGEAVVPFDQNNGLFTVEKVPAVKPTVLTKDAANVTPAGGTLQGEITGNGGGTISAYGFLWSGDNKVSWTTETLGSSEPAGGFEKALGGLTAEKTYYYQAFATNEAGTTTGAVKEFTTEAVPVNPVLTAGNGSGLAGADVQIPVNLSSQGQIAGLQFNLSFDPAILTFTGVSKGTNTADMTVSGNLVAGSDHQAIVIVMNMENDLIAAGTGSVAVLNFKVKDGAAGSCGLNLGGVMLSDADGEAVVPFDQNNGLFTVEKVPTVKPTVLTKDAANVTPAGGTLQGEITGNGGGTISAYGFLWSGDNKVSWTTETLGSSEPAGGFEKALGGLTAEKTYYYQAFATNEAGTTTGAVKEFTTEAVPVNPVLTAGNGSGLAGADVQIPVNLSSQGQIAGLQFNLSFDPAILTFTGVSKGTNTADMTVSGNLVAGSDHQAIVIVMNMENDLIAAGTGSVAVLNFKVKDGAAGSCGLNLGGVMLSDADGEAVVPFDQHNGTFTVREAIEEPFVLNRDAENITTSSATIRGEIVSNGGGTISQYGFRWRKGGDADWTLVTVGTDNGTSIFSKALTSLQSGQAYSFQAFAVNEAGIQWAAEPKIFSTKSASGGGGGGGGGGSGAPAEAITVTPDPLVAAGGAGISFSDIAADYWAANNIYALELSGIIDGYPDDTFKPYNPITRAEFSKIVAIAMNLQLESPLQPSFKDVAADAWYYAYVEAAAKAGFVKGDGHGYFRPEDLISRQEVAIVLVRAMGQESAALSRTGEATKFADDQMIKAWARGYVLVAVDEQFINGFAEDNTFKPVNNATRAESSAMVSRFITKRIPAK